MEVLIRRLHGVLVARQYVLLDYDVPKTPMEKATARPPASNRPRFRRCTTRTGPPCAPWSRAKDTNHMMDELYELGARAILVSTIHAAASRAETP